MKCPFCGTTNQPGEDFCSNCGGYLAAAPGPADATVVTTPPVKTTPGGNTTPGGGSGTSTLTVSTRLQNGRYLVEKILGQGGMGAAVLARDSRVSNKAVVIKELISDNTDPTQRQEDVRNFEMEVETLANLDHPLVPSVTDSFQEGSHYFMVQEYVAGENLEEHMEQLRKPMPEKEALTYASQVLDILDYLSSQKPPIIHRDIKPANIIIGSKDKRAHLVDFGIARADVAKQAAKRKQTTGLGTPGYAPPEQYQGNADPRSDLYALAATLHHLVTNRDPRDYPPFNFPPARTLNPQLSADTERVLEHALTLDASKRYQSAAAMKHDVDEILARRFASSGDMSNYTLRTSTPLAPNPRAAAANLAPPPIPTSAPPPRVYQQQQQQPLPMPKHQPSSGNSWVRFSFIGLIIVAILIGAFSVIAPRLNRSSSQGSASPIIINNGATPSQSTPNTTPAASDPVSVQTIGKETIGISDGRFVFDTNRKDADNKAKAADALKQGDAVKAQSFFSAAISDESNDAEALIYLEDLRIANSPHITFVVGAMPSGDDSIVGVSRDNLQGAYLAQKEFNSNNKLPGGLKARLLIASSGGQTANATLVAQQIVQLAKSDPTFVGVMGWPFSGLTVAAAQVLAQNNIPMVSSSASTDLLTGISPYFFRVVPANTEQGVAGAVYAQQTLGAKSVVVFADAGDPYSQSLGADFSKEFQNRGGTVIPESYTRNDAGSIQKALADALTKNPDLIYFSGYANDVSTLLTGIAQTPGVPDSLRVLGGDALYELAGYAQSARPAYNRLHFTTFAFPDEWGVAGLGNQQPNFFKEYPNTFSGGKTGYGLSRPTGDTIIAYDAMSALLNAAASTGKTTIKPEDIKQALGTVAFQGASGYIKFGSDGNPVNKAFVVLKISPDGFTQMDKVVGSLVPAQ